MSESNTLGPDAGTQASVALPDDPANPVLVEVTRGPMVESRHRGAVAIVDDTGTVQAHWGAVDTLVYPRSAIKPLQAIGLIESGAADAFALSDAEVALSCASHGGEPRHVETVLAWLDRLGLSAHDLECGAQWPMNADAAHALARAGVSPGAEHNNCSGKHTGFLTLASHMGKPTKGYIKSHHAVQQYVMGTLESMCEVDLSEAPCGIDGCSVPTWALPIGNLALGMAKFGTADRMSDARADACRRIATAMADEPFMVAGSGRYCTDMLAATKGKVICKTGAEAVYCAAVPEYGVGVALKCDDGASRAAEVMLTAVLRKIGVLDGIDPGVLAHLGRPHVHTRNDILVGEIRPTHAF